MALVQWITSDNEMFRPAPSSIKALPPGYYNVGSDMSGVYFCKRSTKTEELLRFPDSACDAILEEVDKFWKLEDKFKQSRIPYKRGIVMFGPPGSGKTSAIRMAIENLVNQHKGIVMDFPNPGVFDESYNALRQIQPTIPLIVLMEDLDAILNRSSESMVLNILDGVTDIDKTIFLATTNYPEKLGSRILNRPSRFDKKIQIGMPNESAREMYIKTKLVNENEQEIKKWVKDTDGLSIAHIKELFVAHKILGEQYNKVLSVLRSMKYTPDSSDFDDYNQPKAFESKLWGSGKVYEEAKKRSENLILEIAENLDDLI